MLRVYLNLEADDLRTTEDLEDSLTELEEVFLTEVRETFPAELLEVLLTEREVLLRALVLTTLGVEVVRRDLVL